MMELTQEERDDLRSQAENARELATIRFRKVMRRANRAAAKAGARAAARARSKGKSDEKIEQAREDAAYEDWELEWVRDYIRIDPELATRVFYGIREEKYVDEAVERAGRAAAAKLEIEPSNWWDCAYCDEDEDFEEDADPSEVGEGHAHANPDLHLLQGRESSIEGPSRS